MDQPDHAAFLIVDEAHLERPEVPLVPLIDGWETVEEMEKALGIPEGNLVATLNRYNEHAAKGEDPDFRKQPEYLAAQNKGPWGAFDLPLGKAMYSAFTLGGLATSVDAQVLREDGSARGGYLLDQVRGGEVAVGEQQHALVEAAQKLWRIGGFAQAQGAEDGVEYGAGAARDHGQHPQHRIPRRGRCRRRPGRTRPGSPGCRA